MIHFLFKFYILRFKNVKIYFKVSKLKLKTLKSILIYYYLELYLNINLSYLINPIFKKLNSICTDDKMTFIVESGVIKFVLGLLRESLAGSESPAFICPYVSGLLSHHHLRKHRPGKKNIDI